MIKQDGKWLLIGDRWCHLSGAFADQCEGGLWRAGFGFEGLLPGRPVSAETAKKVALNYALSK